MQSHIAPTYFGVIHIFLRELPEDGVIPEHIGAMQDFICI
jgi:hypothetical protein